MGGLRRIPRGTSMSSTTPSPAPATPPVEAKRSNGAGLSALIVGIVAFVFAIIPFLSFIAWLPALAAIILGIVGLVLKHRKRGFALAGLIIGVVAWIVAILVSIAGIAAVGTAIDEANDTTVAPTEEGGAPAEPEAADAGSRENPVPIGTAIDSQEWTVVVNAWNPNGTDIVAAANQFNQPAPAGSTYAIVNYTVTYKGGDTGNALEVGVDLVTSTGEVIDPGIGDAVVLEDGISYTDELYAGGTATGSRAIAVPDGAQVLIRITPGYVSDPKFVQP